MQNALARPGAPSYSLAYRFGGTAPVTSRRESGGGRFSLSSLTTTIKDSATRELPNTALQYSPAVIAHMAGAALDQSAIGARIQGWVKVKPTTLGVVATTAVALAAPSRPWRKAATLLLLGFIHAKLHPVAAGVPELITRLADPAPAA